MKSKRAKRKKPLTIYEFSAMGNSARQRLLTPERRQEIARKAIAARWRRYRERYDKQRDEGKSK
jgi:hypothetical protein